MSTARRDAADVDLTGLAAAGVWEHVAGPLRRAGPLDRSRSGAHGARVMVLAFLLVLAAVAALALPRVLHGRRERRALAKLASDWARPREKRRNMERIGLYARLTGRDGPGAVDERTWRDLDLDAVFAHVDRTVSVVGQQILSARLRAPPRDGAEREAFEALVQRFGEDRPLREQAQLALLPLADLSASTLPLLFVHEQPAFPWRWLPPLLTTATVVNLAFVAVHPAFLLAVLACFALNLALRFRVWSGLSSFVEPARELDALLAAGRRLAAPELAVTEEASDTLRRALDALGRMPRAVSWLATDRTAGDELAAVVLEYLNVFLLFDVNAYAVTLDLLHRSRSAVGALYETVGRLDVAISVASLRAGAEPFGRPEIDDAGHDGGPAGPLVLEALVHPLVPAAVPNTLSLEARGLFITGSNMSGKSTFLKAAGVNVILAQALGTAFAKRYRAPFLTVQTLIVGADSITEGKSYYLAEVLAALDRLQALGQGGRHLVLVDEPFRGTNTEERIGAGKAYLEALVRRGALTLAASHDRELGSLLGETFRPVHFTERVDGQEIVFDYILRDGPCPTRNAIRVLEIAGFSAELVAEARRVAQWLTEARRPANAGLLGGVGLGSVGEVAAP